MKHAVHGTKTLVNVEGIWFAGDNKWKKTDDWVAANPTTPTDPTTPTEPVPGKVINGTSKAEYIVGTAGNDTINAGAGDDGIYAGKGNDRIDGGKGWDTLELKGKVKDYVFSANGDGTYLLTSTLHGNKIVENIEGVWFTGEKVWHYFDDLAG